MQLTLNQDIVRWLDQHRGDKSRAAYLVAVLKESMQYTAPTGENHTKGSNGIYIGHGVINTPEQD